jgi:hypothetical protein
VVGVLVGHDDRVDSVGRGRIAVFEQARDGAVTKVQHDP